MMIISLKIEKICIQNLSLGEAIGDLTVKPYRMVNTPFLYFCFFNSTTRRLAKLSELTLAARQPKRQE